MDHTLDPAFDGHQARDFASMTPEERLEDLSRKIALVHELRRSRIATESQAASPSTMEPPRAESR